MPPRSDFWKSVEKLAREGKVPFVEIATDPIPDPKRMKVRLYDPEKPFQHYRTRYVDPKRQPVCLRRGCGHFLRKKDLFVCSSECEEMLKKACIEILRVFEERPEKAYLDFVKQIGYAFTRRRPVERTNPTARERGYRLVELTYGVRLRDRRRDDADRAASEAERATGTSGPTGAGSRDGGDGRSRGLRIVPSPRDDGARNGQR